MVSAVSTPPQSEEGPKAYVPSPVAAASGVPVCRAEQTLRLSAFPGEPLNTIGLWF